MLKTACYICSIFVLCVCVCVSLSLSLPHSPSPSLLAAQRFLAEFPVPLWWHLRSLNLESWIEHHPFEACIWTCLLEWGNTSIQACFKYKTVSWVPAGVLSAPSWVSPQAGVATGLDPAASQQDIAEIKRLVQASQLDIAQASGGEAVSASSAGAPVVLRPRAANCSSVAWGWGGKIAM